jgi:hypothetical protein
MKVITTMTSTITIVAYIFCTHEQEVREWFCLLKKIDNFVILIFMSCKTFKESHQKTFKGSHQNV